MQIDETTLDKKIENILAEKLGHFLEDISFRINQGYELIERAQSGVMGKVFAEDLNIKDRHFITGYAVTNNSPVAGSIAWSDLHIVYDGVDNTITNGNTALKYAWWSPTVTPTVLQSSNTKPILAAGEVLLFVNTSGAAKVMLSDTNSSLPSVLSDGSVDSGAIIAKAVGTTALADLAVGSGQLGANAVIAGKINAGGISASNQFALNVVDTNAIKPLAVTGAELNAGAVTAGKIAVGGISASNQIANQVVDAAQIKDAAIATAKLAGNAVDSTKLADGAVSTAAKLGSNVVTAVKVAPGVIDATKLNVMRHFLF